MRAARACLPAAAIAALLVPAGASAQGLPTPPRGGVDVATTWPKLPALTYLAGVPVDVQIRYRERARRARLAARFTGTGACPRRPSTRDRRRLKVLSREGRVLSVQGRGSFRGGENRICIWVREGRAFRRPKTVKRTFNTRLFAASAAEYNTDGVAVSTIDIASSRPIAGSKTQQQLRCDVQTEPVRSREPAVGIHRVGTTRFTGSPCNTMAFQVASPGAGAASLAVGPTAQNAPARVVSHVGDCNVEAAQNLAVPAPLATAFATQLGCRVGKLIPAKSETRARGGLPANGAVFGAQVRGRPVFLAPKGTVVDLLVDSKR